MSDLPDYFYVFCNFSSWLTMHNYRLAKVFSSSAFTQALFDSEFRKKYIKGTVEYLPFKLQLGDLQTISPFALNITNDYRVEHDAEIVRRKFYPKLPSRLSAVYAFASEEECSKPAEKYHWDVETIRQFNLQPSQLNRSVKVNMEVVSIARAAYATSSLSPEEVEKIWHHYWSGGGNLSMELPSRNLGQRETLNSGEIWEYLIEGSLKAIV